MIAREIIVSFYIFRLLKYERTFGKSLERDTDGVNKVLDPVLCVWGGQYQVWPLEIRLVFFFFITRLSSCKNIFETET